MGEISLNEPIGELSLRQYEGFSEYPIWFMRDKLTCNILCCEMMFRLIISLVPLTDEEVHIRNIFAYIADPDPAQHGASAEFLAVNELD